MIDPDHGALHESATHGLWLGPPKTPASARTITLPPFLITLLQEHLAATDGPCVFATRTGCPIRRSTFDRRVFRPAVDGDARRGMPAVRPGLTFHGLRHSHKTWLIADHVPEIAQARRLGHHLANRLVEVYSHVAPEIEQRLLTTLEQRYRHAHRSRRPKDTRPRNRRSREHAHHTAPAQRNTATPRQKAPAPQFDGRQSIDRSSIQDTNVLLNCSSNARPHDHDSHGQAILYRMKEPPTRTSADSKDLDQLWS